MFDIVISFAGEDRKDEEGHPLKVRSREKTPPLVKK